MSKLNVIKHETGVWGAYVDEKQVGGIVTLDGGDGSIACQAVRSYEAYFRGFSRTGTLASCKKWLNGWAEILLTSSEASEVT